MIARANRPADLLRHWWQRRPWVGLGCGWCAILVLLLGAARSLGH